MRIVSLLPATTEWAYAFGAGEDLVGRSHECDAPPAALALPVVTRTSVPTSADASTIQARVQQSLAEGLSLFDVDFDLLRSLRPDLVLTQAQCEVCAVSASELEGQLAGWTGGRPELFSFSPRTFKQILEAALRLGARIGRSEAAMQVVGEAEKRLRLFQERLEEHRPAGERPTVACIEWLDPLMTAGHWMPDVVELAGGRAVLAEQGRPSDVVAWEALRTADPDVLAIMPCGFTIEQTAHDLHHLTEQPGWSQLSAVRSGNVVVFDGHTYFNRPGPRLYRAVELLGTTLHPRGTDVWELDVADWECRPLMALQA